MKAIPTDYEPEEQEFEAYKDGKYDVNSFDYFSTDEDGRPILVVQAGDMVARVRFNLTKNGEEGPPYSFKLSQVPLLVRAFKADADKLPPTPSLDQAGKVSAYLQKAKGLVEEAGNSVKVVVTKGWVKSISGMDVPTGLYYFNIVDVSPKDENGDPETREGQYGKFFFIKCRVVAGEGGQETVWEDAEFDVLVNYSIVVDDQGEPGWAKSKSGGPTASATRLSRLMTYTAPIMFDDDDFEPEDPYNFLPQWWRLAQEANVTLKGLRGKDKKNRVKLDLSSVEPAASFQKVARQPTKETETKVAMSELDMDEEARSIFREFMNLLTGEDAFRKGTFTLTQAGKVLAGQYLTPLKGKGLFDKAKMGQWTLDEVRKVIDHIRKKLEGETQEQADKMFQTLANIGLGFDSDEEF